MFKVGDRVEVKTKTETFTGVVMPAPEEEKDLLILKLSSGYNVPIKLTKEISAIKIGEEKFEGLPTYRPPFKDLPFISIITTGGTITSRVDYKTGAVAPLKTADELLLTVPELHDIVNIKRIHQPFSLLSEDMSSVEWKKIAELVEQELKDDEISGVIVTHGTDILHYTAAALSFMLKNLSKPVAIVGGQRSSDRGSFDGAQNLICAAHYCKSEIAEVAIVMHATESDDYCFATRGTKVRKMHTSRRDAFRPINELPFAKIWPSGKLEIINKNFCPRRDHHAETVLDTRFESKIALLRYFPGADPEIFENLVEKGYRGIVIEATGLGHVAVNPLQKKNSWLPAIKAAVEKGILVCFAPQTIYGRLDPYVYANARLLLNAGVIFLEDMLPETAYVKLGIVLGRTKDIAQAKKLMLENISGEINKRIEPEAFLY